MRQNIFKKIGFDSYEHECNIIYFYHEHEKSDVLKNKEFVNKRVIISDLLIICIMNYLVSFPRTS